MSSRRKFLKNTVALSFMVPLLTKQKLFANIDDIRTELIFMAKQFPEMVELGSRYLAEGGQSFPIKMDESLNDFISRLENSIEQDISKRDFVHLYWYITRSEAEMLAKLAELKQAPFKL